MTAHSSLRRARVGATGLAAAVIALGSVAAAPAAGAAASAPSYTTVESFGTGLLGDGTQGTRAAPGKIAALSGVFVTAVSAGFSHTLALSSGGKVFAWGSNSAGALGDGTTTSTYTPEAIVIPAGVGRVVSVAAGWDASAAVTSTGQVLTWGVSDTLGDHSATNRSSPAAITLPHGLKAKSVAMGYHFDEVLTTNGQVWGWGANADGQLGTGNFGTFQRPARAQLPTTFTATSVAAGFYHTVASGTDASTGKTAVRAWGDDTYGQLGRGTQGSTSNVPVTSSIPASAAPIAAVYAGSTESAAVDANGAAYLWGQGLPGANGTYPDGSNVPKPAPLPSGTVVTSLVVTGSAMLATTAANQLFGWGETGPGGLGPHAGSYVTTPATIALPSGTITGTSSTGEITYADPAAALSGPPVQVGAVCPADPPDHAAVARAGGAK